MRKVTIEKFQRFRRSSIGRRPSHQKTAANLQDTDPAEIADIQFPTDHTQTILIGWKSQLIGHFGSDDYWLRQLAGRVDTQNVPHMLGDGRCEAGLLRNIVADSGSEGRNCDRLRSGARNHDDRQIRLALMNASQPTEAVYSRQIVIQQANSTRVLLEPGNSRFTCFEKGRTWQAVARERLDQSLRKQLIVCDEQNTLPAHDF